MIVVRVELWSAITGERTEIARMLIANTGHGTANQGDYTGKTLRGRSTEALDKSSASQTHTHQGKVLNHARRQLHVWHLVAKMLSSMGYGI